MIMCHCCGTALLQLIWHALFVVFLGVRQLCVDVWWLARHFARVARRQSCEDALWTIVYGAALLLNAAWVDARPAARYACVALCDAFNECLFGLWFGFVRPYNVVFRGRRWRVTGAVAPARRCAGPKRHAWRACPEPRTGRRDIIVATVMALSLCAVQLQPVGHNALLLNFAPPHAMCEASVWHEWHGARARARVRHKRGFWAPIVTYHTRDALWGAATSTMLMPIAWPITSTGMRATHGNGPGKGRLFRKRAMALERRVEWGANEDPIAAMTGAIGVDLATFDEGRFAADGPLIFYGACARATMRDYSADCDAQVPWPVMLPRCCATARVTRSLFRRGGRCVGRPSPSCGCTTSCAPPWTPGRCLQCCSRSTAARTGAPN